MTHGSPAEAMVVALLNLPLQLRGGYHAFVERHLCPTLGSVDPDLVHARKPPHGALGQIEIHHPQ